MKLNKKVAISESGFVFDPSSGDSYSMNSIGLEIVGLIKSGKTDDEIKTELLEKYDVSTPILEKSLDEFLLTLKNLNIVRD